MTNLDKVIYTSKSHVKKAIKEHKQKFNQDMRSYRCRCDGTKHFHLTSQSKPKALLMREGKIVEEIY